MSYDKCERVLGKVDKAFEEYGKNRIYLVGKNLNDLFLRDLRDGCYSLLKNLKFYGEDKERFDWFIYVKENKKVVYYEKINGKFIQRETKDFIKQKTSEKANLFMKNKDKKEIKDKDVAEAVDQAMEGLENEEFYRLLIELGGNKHEDKEVLVYIENFDWTAKFYESETDSKLINGIKGLEKLRKHLVVISLKQIKTLEEKYFEEFDEKELIEIGKPNIKEIETALFRISWMEFGKDIKNLDYEGLASQFSKSNSTLREVTRTFKNKLKEYREELTLEDFTFKTKVEENVLWKDVILDRNTKERISKNIEAFIGEEKSSKKGMIFTGPPGTGKTHIAKAIANEHKIYFMCPKLSDLKGQYVGQSAPKIKALFEEARLNEPTLIFLDEVDTLFPLRDSDDGDSYTKDITNEFLQQLDGVNTGTQKIYVLGATNRIESIDLAVKNRLGMPLEIGLPNGEERIEHFKVNLKNVVPQGFWRELPEDCKKNLIDRSEGMSGRDIKDFSSMDLKRIMENMDRTDPREIYKTYFTKGFRERKKYLISKLENKTGLCCLSSENISEKNLFGIEKIKNKMKNVVNQIKKDEKKKREDFNLELQNGILLYGPPGNGKSELVEEVARENGMILVKVESKDTIGYTNRDTLENIDNIFSQGLQLSKICEEDEGVILFFDEFDSLVGTEMSSTVRGTLLGKIADKRGIRSKDSKLILIGATNHQGKIDEGIKRKGRFDVHLELDNPSKEVAIRIIENMLKNERMSIIEDDILGTIDLFYESIKNIEVEAQIKVFRKAFGYMDKNQEEEEKFQRDLERLKREFTVSSSYMKSMVIELKRFILKDGTYKKEESLKITKDKLLKFKEEIEG